MKRWKSAIVILLLTLCAGAVRGAVVTPKFPTSLNWFSEGDTIEEEDFNSLESYIGVRGTESTTTVTYRAENAITTSTWSTILATKTTDNLTEGSSNQYWTAARGTANFSTNIAASYDASLGALTATGNVTFGEGTNRLYWNASEEKLYIAPYTSTSVVSGSESLHFADDDGSDSDLTFRVANGGYATLNFVNARGTLSAPTVNTGSDILGEYNFMGWDGTGYHMGARIDTRKNGTIASGRIPADLVFYVMTPSGTSTALILDSSGGARFENTVTSSGLSVTSIDGIVRCNGASATCVATTTVSIGYIGSSGTRASTTYLRGDDTWATFDTAVASYITGSSICTLAGAQTLTNKTMAYANNTFSGIATSTHTHSSGTITEADPLALLTAGTDNVKDTHIDWGTGAGQVSTDDVTEGTAKFYTDARVATYVTASSGISTLNNAQTLTNKTIAYASNTLTGVATSNAVVVWGFVTAKPTEDSTGDCDAGNLCSGGHTHSGYQAGDVDLTSLAGGLTGIAIGLGDGNGYTATPTLAQNKGGTNVTGCTSGQVLKANASNIWACGTDADSGAGTGSNWTFYDADTITPSTTGKTVSSNKFVANVGTVAAPSYTFSGYTDTGTYVIGAAGSADLYLGTDGIKRLRVNSQFVNAYAPLVATSGSFTSKLVGPYGTNPAPAEAGSIAVDTTDGQFQFYNGALNALSGTFTKTFTLATASSTGFVASDPVVNNLKGWRVPYDITVTRIDCNLSVTGYAEVALMESVAETGAITNIATNGLDGATTINCDNDGARDDLSLSNPTLDAGDYLRPYQATVTSTPQSIVITASYKITAK